MFLIKRFFNVLQEYDDQGRVIRKKKKGEVGWFFIFTSASVST